MITTTEFYIVRIGNRYVGSDRKFCWDVGNGNASNNPNDKMAFWRTVEQFNSDEEARKEALIVIRATHMPEEALAPHIVVEKVVMTVTKVDDKPKQKENSDDSKTNS